MKVEIRDIENLQVLGTEILRVFGRALGQNNTWTAIDTYALVGLGTLYLYNIVDGLTKFQFRFAPRVNPFSRGDLENFKY